MEIINKDIVFFIDKDSENHSCSIPGCKEQDVYILAIRPNVVPKSYHIINSDYICKKHINTIYKIDVEKKIASLAKKFSYTDTGNYQSAKIQFIKDNFGKMTYEEMSKELGMKIHTLQIYVSKHRKELGLEGVKPKIEISKKKLFDEEEIQFIRDNYDKMSYSEMSKALNKTQHQIINYIYTRREELGIPDKRKKNPKL